MITRILLLLTIGAMLNLGIAWACAVWSSTGDAGFMRIGRDGWPDRYIDRRAALGIGKRTIDETIWRRDQSFRPGTRDVIAPIQKRRFVQAGWPALSMQSFREEGTLHGGLAVTPDIALPLMPMGWGFVVNTLLWAAVAYLIACLCEFRAIARIIHRRCHECGYDLRATNHERCPECGAIVEQIGERG